MAKTNLKKTVGEVKLHDMTVAELSAKIKLLKIDVGKKRLEKSVGRLKNLREIFKLRKELARLKTIIVVKSENKI